MILLLFENLIPFTNVIADIKLAIKLNETGYMETPLSAKKYSCKLNPINVFEQYKQYKSIGQISIVIFKYLCSFLFATGKTIIQSNAGRY